MHAKTFYTDEMFLKKFVLKYETSEVTSIDLTVVYFWDRRLWWFCWKTASSVTANIILRQAFTWGWRVEQLQMNVTQTFLTYWMPKFRERRPCLKKKKKYLSPYDNAPAHKSALVMRKLRDLAPSIFLITIKEIIIDINQLYKLSFQREKSGE